MNDLFTLFSADMLSLIAKILVVFLTGLYAISVFVVFNHIRSLKRIVIIEHSSGSPFIQSLAFIYLILSIFLFIVALVIL